MAISTLRFAPYSWRRTCQLSEEQQDKLADAVSKLLYNIISSSKSGNETLDNHPDLSWTGTFVDAYLGDLAGHVLRSLVDKPTHPSESYWSEESHSEKSVRTLTLRLFRLLVKTPAPDSDTGVLFSLSNLVDFIIAYGADYPKTTENIFSEALSMLPSGRVASYKNELVSSLNNSLKSVNPSSSSISSLKTTYIVSQILKSITSGNQASPLVMAFAEETDFIEAIAMAYSTCHLNHGKLNSPPDDLDGQRWFRAKIELIDSLHAMVNFLVIAVENRNALFEVLTTLLKDDHLSTRSPSSSGSMSPLNTKSILRDYEFAFNLSQTLMDTFGTDHDDSRIYSIIVSLQELVPEHNKKRTAGPWLEPFLRNRKKVSKSHISGSYPVSEHKRETLPVTDSKRDKGKGKAVDLEEDSVPDIDLAVSQILDIFPDQPGETIRSYLQHPSFQGDTEKVIAALLEGNIPSDLAADEPSEQFVDHQPAPHSEFVYTKDRRNIWDDIAMDESQLRIGKARNDADTLLNDRSFMEQMKADILRRVQEVSDDEEEIDYGIDKGKGKAVAGPTFLDDSEEDVNVKVIGDGEATSDSEDEGDDTEAVPTPETILALAYMDDPKLFDRDAVTRRSKARSDLRAKTGWADEQIEGWRIMLERNPKKDKILSRYEFSGNRSIQAGPSAMQSGSTSQASEQQPSTGRGYHGRGRGRGRGGGGGRGMHHQQGEASSSREHSWKDKNKARMANHNRKRGHDKKMARGFGAGG